VVVRADAVAEVEALQTSLNAYLARVEAMLHVDEFNESESASFVAVMLRAINRMDAALRALSLGRGMRRGRGISLGPSSRRSR
jgi:hypothetical protein